MLRHVALVRTDVSEKLSASFIRVTRIGELETMYIAFMNFMQKKICASIKCIILPTELDGL
jgi:hypothetical protein